MRIDIKYKGELYAYIVVVESINKKFSFFSENELSLQLGYMEKKKGDIIQPHLHLKQKREIYDTQEVLYLRKGDLTINFYDENMFFFHKERIYTESFIHLIKGGHGFEIHENSYIFEVKQGPYLEKSDKKKF